MNKINKSIFNLFKKRIQSFYKDFVYNLFILFYGKIKIKLEEKDQAISVKKVFFEPDISYNIHTVDKSRLYTNSVHDAAVISNNKIVCGASYQFRNNINAACKENIVLSIGTPRFKKKIKGNLFSLLSGGGANSNYWHWLFDVLPRLKILNKYLNLEEINYFLFPDTEKKFQKESLDLLRIPENKRLSSKTNKHLVADKIIVCDHPFVFSENPGHDMENIPKWIFEWLKHSFLKELNLKNKKEFPKKFFIDRSDSSQITKNKSTSNKGGLRDISNKEEVENFLKKKGFTSIILSDLHFIDQVQLFNNAESIVGLHGAGFANLIFCQKNIKVLELRSDTAGNACGNVAFKNNLKFDHLSISPQINYNNQQGIIEVPIKKLQDKLFS